jgi:hypothetical protein
MQPGTHEPAFEAWVQAIFDHPEDASQWQFQDSPLDEWTISSELLVEYITRVFEQPDAVFAPFSDRQVAQSLWYHFASEGSGNLYALLDARVPWPRRKRCADSIFTLFRQYFARRCSPHLGHLDEAPEAQHPANGLCYMWWDIFPTWGKPEQHEQAALDQALLQVMQLTLRLDSDACRESALHGLSHWHLHYPQQVQATIDAFLREEAAQHALRPELLRYARIARAGQAL